MRCRSGSAYLALAAPCSIFPDRIRDLAFKPGQNLLKCFRHSTLTYLAPTNCFLSEHSPKGFDEKSQGPYKNHDDKGQKYDPSNYSDSSVCAVCASFF